MKRKKPKVIMAIVSLQLLSSCEGGLDTRQCTANASPKVMAFILSSFKAIPELVGSIEFYEKNTRLEVLDCGNSFAVQIRPVVKDGFVPAEVDGVRQFVVRKNDRKVLGPFVVPGWSPLL